MGIDMSERPTISLIVHTRNSEATLPRLLETTGWLAERIVVDMESTDGTVELARAAGCKVLSTPPTDAVDSIRNQFLDHATGEWTLVLDSDEYLSADAGEELEKLIAVQGASVDAFAIPRFNSIAGQVMQGSGFYPDCLSFRSVCVSRPAGACGYSISCFAGAGFAKLPPAKPYIFAWRCPGCVYQ